MRRRLLLVLAALLAAGCAATAALAAPADDARAVADRFFAALIAEDGKTACGLFSARAVAILGGPDKCAAGLIDDSGGSSADNPRTGDEDNPDDFLARAILDHVFGDARALGVARGGYVTKQAKVARLVRDLRMLEPELGFSAGKGADAARGTSSNHVIVDSRTSARVLTLYVESDTGTIWRLSAHGFAHATIAKGGMGIAVKPIPAPPTPAAPPQPEVPPTFTVAAVTMLDETSAYATITITYEGKSASYVLSMKLEDGTWKVDDLLVPLFAVLGGFGG